jgi:D-tyrosyl-tRNA(Tyr) deacylase
MRAVIQRVDFANVTVDCNVIGEINRGIVVFLGVGKFDDEKDANYLIEKIANIRIFEDLEGKMNLSLVDIKGGALIISQFTLFADCSRGRRPSFTDACEPDSAEKLYEYFTEGMRKKTNNVATGKFGAAMKIKAINNGPVTIIIDSKK